jgi:hypothetical protein
VAKRLKWKNISKKLRTRRKRVKKMMKKQQKELEEKNLDDPVLVAKRIVKKRNFPKEIQRFMYYFVQYAKDNFQGFFREFLQEMLKNLSGEFIGMHNSRVDITHKGIDPALK